MKLTGSIVFLLGLSLLLKMPLGAQDFSSARVSGSFRTIAQTYSPDSIIDAAQAEEAVLSNSYFNLNYTLGNLTVGARFEAYLNTLKVYPNPGKANDGVGIPYRFVSYNTGMLDITAGNFYEQFGSGLILRSSTR